MKRPDLCDFTADLCDFTADLCDFTADLCDFTADLSSLSLFLLLCRIDRRFVKSKKPAAKICNSSREVSAGG